MTTEEAPVVACEDWHHGRRPQVMDLEVTVHRIGGADGYPRKFGPQPVPVTRTSVDRVCIDGALTMSVFVRLEFAGWTVAGEGWLGCTLRLEDMNGVPLGTRPAMVYDGVSDVPTHTLFHPRHPDAGAFVVALRKVNHIRRVKR